MTHSAYEKAGVDIDAQDLALRKVRKLAKKTFNKNVLSNIGSFGGLFRAAFDGYEDPVLVSSADGVGTKLLVAKRVGDFSSVGRDLVNHCVNDILAQGAQPLFFLDYIGGGILEQGPTVQLVQGLATACRDHGCALLGGETAEMPGLYRPGDYELVGFIVGVVDRPKILSSERVRAGDLLVGLSSSGLHTNGYSLARRIFFDHLGLEVGDPIPGSNSKHSVGEQLLVPHRSYRQALAPVLEHPALHAMAHITGGGLTDNLPRMLPQRTGAEVRMGCWEIPEIFHLLQEHGEIDSEEMFRVFNMGIGMVLAVEPGGLAEVMTELRRARQEAWVIGRVIRGGSGVAYDLVAHPPSDE